ncbi:heat shock protein 68 [Histomonas meleagridis]|uniref:heat shock protein 68 n=1 Tax=Histomonas meleagridis TaxID=135588 RepID=UPI003559FEC0|nr:heat shock protein 68 [Histomonas meleagridis]KAH0798635.1 heat shock protein 68 [Histomonas meleagridis]
MAHLSDNPSNALFDSKRLIGRKFNDPAIKSDINHWPFKITHDRSGRPTYRIEFLDKTIKLYPEEISSLIISQIKENAESYLQVPVTEAVITVPAYFTDWQRQSTTDACKIAGINVLRIINEPTSAAITFGYINNFIGERYVLVYDLGGGTFDVSLLKIGNGKYKVIATSGDTHLGGQDFDNRLFDYFCEVFRKEHKEDLHKSPSALQQLRIACENAKINLSERLEATVYCSQLYNGHGIFTRIERKQFEELNKDLFDSTLNIVQKLLNDNQINKDEINDVILTGGSTNIPYIINMLKNYFGDNKIKRNLTSNISPDTYVASGAAILAAIIKGNKSQRIRNLVVDDVTPISLGVKIYDDEMDIIVPCNTLIPTQKYKYFTNEIDNQKEICLEIYEGESKYVKENKLLGSFNMKLPPAKKNSLQIKVIFNIDENGILNVIAEELSTGKSKGIEVKSNKGRLSDNDIKKISKKELNKLRDVDANKKTKPKAENENIEQNQQNDEQNEDNIQMQNTEHNTKEEQNQNNEQNDQIQNNEQNDQIQNNEQNDQIQNNEQNAKEEQNQNNYQIQNKENNEQIQNNENENNATTQNNENVQQRQNEDDTPMQRNEQNKQNQSNVQIQNDEHVQQRQNENDTINQNNKQNENSKQNETNEQNKQNENEEQNQSNIPNQNNENNIQNANEEQRQNFEQKQNVVPAQNNEQQPLYNEIPGDNPNTDCIIF